MIDAMNRRNFLRLGLTAGAVAMLPRAMSAQAAKAAQPNASAATTPIKITKLYDNLYLLQGEGGNMALQTGAEGDILIDASYAPAVPRILEAIAAESKNAPFMLSTAGTVRARMPRSRHTVHPRMYADSS